MDNIWTQENLNQLHKCLMKIILEVDRVCKKNNITYFLAGGTLLGAVRDGGLLPWDDDADLMMKRGDYDRFCDIAIKELSPDFFIQSHKTDPHSHRPYIRIRLNGTVMASEFSSHFPKSHQGIFVDIFCHDATANSKVLQKIHIIRTKLINSLVFRKWENSATPKIPKGFKNIVASFFSIKMLEKRQNNILRKYNQKNTRYFYDGMGKHLTSGAFPKNWLETEKRISVDGYILPVPNEYDKYLKWLYGDYMKAPDKEHQHPTTNIVELKFGQWSN